MPMIGPAICASVYGSPDLALARIEDADGNDEEQQYLEPGAVSNLQVRLGSPGQKADDIVRHLRHRRRRTVGKGRSVVAKRWRHRDLTAREVFIVLHSLQQVEAGWGILVAVQQGVDVIGTPFTRLDDH